MSAQLDGPGRAAGEARGCELAHLVYASSSSVYGGNTKLPFAIEDRVDHPLSLYAATKKANELIVQTYCHLFRAPDDRPALLHGLRTLGPARHGGLSLHPGDPGRQADPVFNHGEMRRDFTYIDDIVAGVVACARPAAPTRTGPRRRTGSTISATIAREELRDFIAAIERADHEAQIRVEPMQPGDVPRDLGRHRAPTRAISASPRPPRSTSASRASSTGTGYHGV